MNRRGFLGSILALGAAPAIVRADSLMRIVPRETTVLWGKGIASMVREDQAAFNGITREALQIAWEKHPVFGATHALISIPKDGETLVIRRPLPYIRRGIR